MKDIINKAIDWLKEQDIDGCITGSALLDYYEGQDIDLFVYNESSFTKILYGMKHNPMFQLLEPIEQWKFKEWTNNKKSSLEKLGLITIKFKYNLAVDVNVIYKKKDTSIFNVISSFDLDIISKGYDIKTKQTLDLSQNDGKTAHWNKWNTSFYADDIWTISRLLRQFERCIKYHRRGYNTDLLVEKYIELLDKLIEYHNIFNSVNFDEKLVIMKANGKILKAILTLWLEKHELSDEELVLLQSKIKEL
jgi:hypothetical protein